MEYAQRKQQNIKDKEAEKKKKDTINVIQEEAELEEKRRRKIDTLVEPSKAIYNLRRNRKPADIYTSAVVTKKPKDEVLSNKNTKPATDKDTDENLLKRDEEILAKLKNLCAQLSKKPEESEWNNIVDVLGKVFHQDFSFLSEKIPDVNSHPQVKNEIGKAIQNLSKNIRERKNRMILQDPQRKFASNEPLGPPALTDSEQAECDDDTDKLLQQHNYLDLDENLIKKDEEILAKLKGIYDQLPKKPVESEWNTIVDLLGKVFHQDFSFLKEKIKDVDSHPQ